MNKYKKLERPPALVSDKYKVVSDVPIKKFIDILSFEGRVPIFDDQAHMYPNMPFEI